MLVSVIAFDFKRILGKIDEIKTDKEALCGEFLDRTRIEISKSVELFKFFLGLLQLAFGIFPVRNARRD